ncbi:MAG: decaprenyl-phosphate phosphoribosyltransferase [Anaerolineaceae bacterium]|nr:decaprenyl-phosphate phosphoribosyltransferase [Anaerolineaceae bacterium]
MIRDIFYSLRPKQWFKNFFIFSALVFDRQLTNSKSVSTTVLGFIIFCALSSSVYVFNDLFDIEADKNHPLKKNRPIASGRVSISLAIVLGFFIGFVSLFLAYWLSFRFFQICLYYLVINLFYSKWLKHFPIIDVLIIASGFVLRVAAGVSLVKVERFSPWLYVVTTLLALFIGFGKRRAELALLAGSANQHRIVFDGYTLEFLDQLITIVSGTTIIGYSFYTFSAPNLPNNHAMMLTIPFVLYGIFRYLYLIKVKESGGAPEELLMNDKPLQLSIILWGLSVLVIFYFT